MTELTSPLALKQEREAAASASQAGQGFNTSKLLDVSAGPNVVDLEARREARRSVMLGQSSEVRPSRSAEALQHETAPPGLVDAFTQVCARWALDYEDSSRLLSLEPGAGYLRLMLRGMTRPLSGDMRSRMALIVAISLGLGEMFDDDQEAENRWLRSPRDDLAGHAPLVYLLNGSLIDCDLVHQIIKQARNVA